jgi:hypothetical protein
MIFLNIMKVFKTFLLLSFLLAGPAHAGVMTKMVEVDSECSRELDVMRVELEEVKASNLTLSDRINRLLNDNILLTAENKTLKEKNAVLSSQIAGLKQNNLELASKIQELKSQVEAQAITPSVAAPIQENEDLKNKIVSKKSVSNYLWPVVAVPLGAVAGSLRGLAIKGFEYSDTASSNVPKTIPTLLVAKIGGLLIGNIAGAVTGLIRGVVDGVKYGFSDPYSPKSVSLDGDFASDWDPYEIEISRNSSIERN